MALIPVKENVISHLIDLVLIIKDDGSIDLKQTTKALKGERVIFL